MTHSAGPSFRRKPVVPYRERPLGDVRPHQVGGRLAVGEADSEPLRHPLGAKVEAPDLLVQVRELGRRLESRALSHVVPSLALSQAP